MFIGENYKYLYYPLLFLLRKAIKIGKEVHDREYMKIDFDVRIAGTPDTHLVTTSEIPYYSSNEGTKHREIRRSFRTNQMSNHHGNLLTRPDWHHTDLQIRLAYLLRRKRQELCKGIVRVLD